MYKKNKKIKKLFLCGFIVLILMFGCKEEKKDDHDKKCHIEENHYLFPEIDHHHDKEVMMEDVVIETTFPETKSIKISLKSSYLRGDRQRLYLSKCRSINYNQKKYSPQKKSTEQRASVILENPMRADVNECITFIVDQDLISNDEVLLPVYSEVQCILKDIKVSTNSRLKLKCNEAQFPDGTKRLIKGYVLDDQGIEGISLSIRQEFRSFPQLWPIANQYAYSHKNLSKHVSYVNMAKNFSDLLRQENRSYYHIDVIPPGSHFFINFYFKEENDQIN